MNFKKNPIEKHFFIMEKNKFEKESRQQNQHILFFTYRKNQRPVQKKTHHSWVLVPLKIIIALQTRSVAVHHEVKLFSEKSLRDHY